MAFIINQGFDLKSPQFNFERDYFNNVAELKAAKEDWFPDNFITNVGGTLYQLKKSNSVDSTTGKWRILKVAPNSTYSHPTGSAPNKALGFYKFSTDATSHISSVSAVTKDDITKLGIPSADTHYTTKLIVGNSITATNNAAATNGNVWLNLLDNTTLREKHNIVGTGRASVTSDANGKITIGVSNYGTATTSADGLMASTDKEKLDGIAAGANKTVVDSTLSTSSINPVQNKVIKAALEGKADSDVGVFTVGVGTPELTINASTADEPSKNKIYATGATGTADIIIQHANSTGAVDDVVKVNVDGIVVNEHRAAIGAIGDANNQDWTLTGSKTQITGKSITSPKFVKTGGTSEEILMADGSVATSITTSQIQALFN